MVFGTFDMFHDGHRSFLRQAGEHGDRLLAVVARDSTVKRVKGYPSERTEEQRLKDVKSSGLVDDAVLGKEGDKYSIIEDVNPDVICLGYDQDAFTKSLGKELKKRNISCEVVRLKPYKPHIFKTSIIKKTERK